MFFTLLDVLHLNFSNQLCVYIVLQCVMCLFDRLKVQLFQSVHVQLAAGRPLEPQCVINSLLKWKSAFK